MQAIRGKGEDVFWEKILNKKVEKVEKVERLRKVGKGWERLRRPRVTQPFQKGWKRLEKVGKGWRRLEKVAAP